jgi:hypothetical protein
MVSGATMYVPNFIKIGSSIQKLTSRYTNTQTHKHIDTLTAW